MSTVLIVIFTYLVDKFFGDFPFKLHPLALIREWVEFFEEKFYKDTVGRGFLLLMFILTIVASLSIAIHLYLIILPIFIYVIVSSLIASIFITHEGLKNSEEESYTINLCNNIVAPLFYLLLFNLPGIIIYKTINTMNSILQENSEKHQNYANATTSLDNVLNYIPSKIVILLVMLHSKMNNDKNI